MKSLFHHCHLIAYAVWWLLSIHPGRVLGGNLKGSTDTFIENAKVSNSTVGITRKLDESDQSESLLSAVSKAAGYYLDNDASRAKGLEKMLIVTLANDGYTDHLQNFRCFMERLGLKFLVIAVNDQIHEHASARGFYSYRWRQTGRRDADAKLSSFGSNEFNTITKMKKGVVADIVKLGYDVLFSDLDIVFVKDPIKYLRIPGVDYMHSANARCSQEKFTYNQKRIEGNTGFYFLRSSPASISVWEQAVTKLATLGADDQTAFWNYFIDTVKDPVVVKLPTCFQVREHGTADMISRTLSEKGITLDHGQEVFTMCPLHECIFTSGMLSPSMRKPYFANKERFATIHANFQISFNKQTMLADYGYWLATKSSDGKWDGPCRNDFRPALQSELKGGYP